MNKRPLTLYFIAGLWLVSALFLWVLLIEHGAPSPWIPALPLIVLALINAALAFEASRWIALTLPLFISAGTAIFLTSGFLPGVMVLIPLFLAHGVFLLPTIRRVLRQPELRWWQTPKRARLALNARVCPVLGGEIASRTFDVSEAGAFIAFEDPDVAPKLEKALSTGAYCSIRLSLNEFHSLNCSARIIRRSARHGAYPQGFAVRFVSLHPQERRHLARFLRSTAA